ncbi:hypothetical protein [Micromonospora sp. DPT]|uniref:hypothetical protein n=1 Tax=Micromonospora sp. DPT TaxID=3142975 RepID=UPI00320A3D0A
MARLVGPDESSRLSYTLPSDNRLGTAAGLPAVVYADEAATTLADILTYPGGLPVEDSELEVGASSLLPLFQFPDGADVVYVSVNGGPVSPVYARRNRPLPVYLVAVGESIQTAIDAAAAGGGGIVYLANGTHTLTAGLTMKTGVTLTGTGSENVVLRLGNGVNQSVITSEGFSTLTGTQPVDPDLTASGPSGWAIRGVEIVGNKANQSGTSWGVRVFGYGYVMDDVRIRDCLSGGMYTEFAHSGPYNPTPTGVEAEFTNLRIHHNDGHGWHMRGPNDSHAISCMIWENTGYGLWAQTISGGCSANGFNMFNVHTYGSGHDWGMIFDAAVMASNCQAEGAGVGGGNVWIRYADCSWIGGAIYDINPAGGNALGLRLGDAATNTYAVRARVQTQFLGWTGADAAHAAVDFARSSNCWIDGRVHLTTATGTAIAGTPDPTDVVALAVSGSGGMTSATALQKSIFKQRGVTTFDVGVNSQGFRLANQTTDYFNLNTNATPPRFELPGGVQWRMYSGAYTGEKLRIDGSNGHIEAISTTVPAVAALAGVGTSPPAPAVDSNSNDMRGLISFGTGTATATGQAVKVTFAQAFSRPPTVMLIAKNAAAAALQPYLGAVTATDFNINLAVAPTASQAAGTYFVAYMVMG